jgi:BirA family transcriptional regulator, biotin operon repressor / biotin---[acetyl-CoA-carboxylase] ligase
MTSVSNRIIELSVVDSTNLYAERILLTQKVKEGTIISAFEQTAGKGQGENNWISEPWKNLTVSMILYPRFLPVERQFMLNKAVSLAVLDIVNTLVLSASCRIKWPNDIYSGTRKLGGILIINTVSGTDFDTSIAGIGININQTEFDPVLPNPTSVKLITGMDTELEMVMTLLIEKMDLRYNQLKMDQSEQLDSEYRENLLGYNLIRKFRTGNGVIEGMITDVDPFGRLIIETASKKQMIFFHNEIELIL